MLMEGRDEVRNSSDLFILLYIIPQTRKFLFSLLQQSHENKFQFISALRIVLKRIISCRWRNQTWSYNVSHL